MQLELEGGLFPVALEVGVLFCFKLLSYKFEENFLQVLIIDPRSAQLRSELTTQSQFNVEFKLTSLTHLENLLGSNLVQKALNKISNQSIASQPQVLNEYSPHQAAEKNEALLNTILSPQMTDQNVSDHETSQALENETKKDDLEEQPTEVVEKKIEQKDISKAIEKKAPSKPTATQKTLKEKWNINDPDLVIDFCVAADLS